MQDKNTSKYFGDKQLNGQEIAIIGMVGRFPGANNIDELWENLCAGKETISFFSEEESRAAGTTLELLRDPRYVRARGVLEGIEKFDGPFFGYTPREAEIIDPQQRIFLECAWEALEHAEYDPSNYRKPVGVYAGSSINTYLANNLQANKDIVDTISHYQLLMGNGADFLTTRVSYKLNLSGPSVTVQTGCSTSLVAVHMACQSLLSGECDMALAGGVAISVPQKIGYLYEEGGIGSPDGHCRAFDEGAHGTVGGEGIGIVVLKRLEDALAEGDVIHAIIKGTAINNDGSSKIGYTAPSIDGQAEVIRDAYTAAEVDPETITYIETHGTGTPLGDPIEIAALNQAFKAKTAKNAYCAIGSIKTNIGHLDTAAGIAGLIKTVLALKHKRIPPSLHFHKANPRINFQDSPFYVNATLLPWEAGSSPRRAGVSSFGIGGTNAHVILEEGPEIDHNPAQVDASWQLLVLSARTKTALEALTKNLVADLKKEQKTLHNVAYTLQIGRRDFNYRRSVVCRDIDGAVRALEDSLAAQTYSQVQDNVENPLVFMFSGQGSQYVYMGRDLYENEPVFKEKIDQCAEILTPYLNCDIRTLLYPEDKKRPEATEKLKQTWLTQPVLFTVEYALASLWMHWGIQPQAMIGHSIGEYVAACLSNVFSLEDALRLVAARGQLMQQLPGGIMISVALPEEERQSLLTDRISLAANNSPSLCVLSGPIEEMEALTHQFEERGIKYQRLHTSHAFHSSMMSPILAPFAEIMRQIKLCPPQAAFISNVSGTWITAEQATDPTYWVDHLRKTVQFASGVQELFRERDWILLEVGPGNTLSVLARQNAPKAKSLTSLRRVQEPQSDKWFALQTLGQLWQAGVKQIHWQKLHPGLRLRVPLPSYPFERQRYWVEPTQPVAALNTRQGQPLYQKKADIADWFYVPTWNLAPLDGAQKPAALEATRSVWLIFKDRLGIGDSIVKKLEAAHETVIIVEQDEHFSSTAENTFAINATSSSDYAILLEKLQEMHSLPDKIIYMWAIGLPLEDAPSSAGIQMAEMRQEEFYSMVYLAQALGKQVLATPIQLWCVSNSVQCVTGQEHLDAAKATILGPCNVISQEYPMVKCGHIDIALDVQDEETIEGLGDQLLTEMRSGQPMQGIAYRNGKRWSQAYDAAPLGKEPDIAKRFKAQGTYLITGGLGGIGLTLAEAIANQMQTNLILLGRSEFPEREEWQTWLREHPVEDGISQKIRKVQGIESLGSRVSILQVDVSDFEQMQAALAQLRASYGHIHGVIHAAGVAGGGAIQMRRPEEIEKVWAAKVHGLAVLLKLFQGDELDFLMLCSSLSAIVGGFGQVDYCAANAFLDAVAQSPNAPFSRFTCSVNWDVWQDVGMAVRTAMPRDLQQQRAAALQQGILAWEGAEAFLRALCSEHPRLLISTRDIRAVLEVQNVYPAAPQRGDVEQPMGASQLATYQRPVLPNEYVAPRTEREYQIGQIWSKYLGIEKIGLHDNFFDLGGHSLVMAQIHSELQRNLGYQVSLVDLLTYPTISSLVQYLEEQKDGRQKHELKKVDKGALRELEEHGRTQDDAVAIIGMAGRFPGAADIETFWENIRGGVESIKFFSTEELVAEGVDEALLNNPNYVKAAPILEGVEQFDADFFGYSPREAEGIDPQQRLFLECAWQALERAGYDPERYAGAIGVYAGLSMNSYLLSTLLANEELLNSEQFMMGNVNDFLATRVSYKLNLRGPSITVQTACSTSLVAVHLACESLKEGKCDIALAGGASVRAPQKRGYLYEEGGITSPDGHCRAFDARAQGTIFGNGVGVVVLKRLSDALADQDNIFAVIRGSAINNDGSTKVGFTAPSIQGQAAVVRQALDMAHFAPETISYVEAHGTGTALGDPAEITALAKAFATNSERKNYCAVGTVKSNIGHLDVAAGVTGLIKTALALKHKELPPSLHFSEPNPQIDFADTPFYVNTQLIPWETNGTPRRAGVSAFGLGGTNAHVVLEEAPVVAPEGEGESRPWYLLSLAAKTPSALQTAKDRLASHLKGDLERDLADVSYTLNVGRRAFAQRLIAICKDVEDAVTVLQTEEPERFFAGFAGDSRPTVVFMFPGGGTQYINMGRELYQCEESFRKAVDQCVDIFNQYLDYNLKQVLYPDALQEAELEQQLSRPTRSLPVIFTTEYALAQLLMHWGVRPQAMIGHSLGEYVAACLAGVFSLEDAIALVALRSQLLEQVPDGAMLSMPLSELEAQHLLSGSLSLAAINGPSQCVVAGTAEDIGSLERDLTGKGIDTRRLHISTAAHSSLLEPVLDKFSALLSRLTLYSPTIPFISNVSGTWADGEEVCSPSYWVKHLRYTVRFSDGIQELMKNPHSVLLEVGPGHTLSVIARQQTHTNSKNVILTTLRHAQKQQSDIAFLLTTVGRLWLAGVDIDWRRFHTCGRRIVLPTYPFERRRYWIDTNGQKQISAPRTNTNKQRNAEDWFYIPSWRLAAPPLSAGHQLAQMKNWLVFVDDVGIGNALVDHLHQTGQQVVIVERAERFHELGDRTYGLNPARSEDYLHLMNCLKGQAYIPQHIVHCWSITGEKGATAGDEATFRQMQDYGYYSLLWLTQSLEKADFIDRYQSDISLSLAVITNQSHSVTHFEASQIEKVPLLGICKVIQQEYPGISCQFIDTTLPQSNDTVEKIIQRLFEELITPSNDLLVAYRGPQRWIQCFEPLNINKNKQTLRQLREKGVYLIVGGLGGIGMVLAEYLVTQYNARLVITSRSPLPPRAQWTEWLASHTEQDRPYKIIQKLQHLESLGAEIHCMSANAADLEQMQDVVHFIYRKFNTLHGVIYTAGITGGDTYSYLPEMDRRKSEEHFQSKVYGLYVIEKLLRGRDLDFYLLFSSNASILGGLGFSAYTSANLFVDAFAAQKTKSQCVPWISTNWDGWQTGQEEGTGPAQSSMDQYRLTAQQALTAFEHILCSTAMSQVAVSSADLNARIDQWIGRKMEREAVMEAAESGTVLYPRRENGVKYIAPRNEVEQTIAETWQDLLGLEKISIYDNYFELGGHSLLALRIAARLRSALHMELPLSKMFAHPSIAELASYILQQKEEAEKARADRPLEAFQISHDPATRHDPFPLTDIQQAYWIGRSGPFELSNVSSHTYVELEYKHLDLERYQAAWQKVIARHDMLRAIFLPDGRQQVLEEVPPFCVHTIDLRNAEPLLIEQSLEDARKQMSHQVFPATNWPLFEVRAFLLDDRRTRIHLSIDALLIDAWSGQILDRELSWFYEHPDESLSPLQLTFRDYVLEEERLHQSSLYRRARDYWMERIPTLPPPPELPLAVHPETLAQPHFVRRSTLIEAESWQKIKALAAQANLTPSAVLLTAFAEVLATWSRTAHFTLNLTLFNRQPVHEQINDIIGDFTSVTLLAIDATACETFEARARKIQTQLWDDLDHRFMSGIQVMRELARVHGNPMRAAMPVIFTSTLAQGEAPAAANLLTAQSKLIYGISQTPQVWLDHQIGEFGDQLVLNWDAVDELFPTGMLDDMFVSYCQLVRNLAAGGERWLENRHQLVPKHHLTQWEATNATSGPTSPALLHTLFAEQVGHRGQHTAVIAADRRMTYQEVYSYANRLGRYLRQLGAVPNTLVAVVMEKGWEQVVGVLGIHTAGAAYLPIDPGLPMERINYLLQHGEVKFVVTQSRIARRIDWPATVQYVCVDTDELESISDGPLPIVQQPQDLAYVIYTSGSTGKPKGVMIDHKGAVNTILDLNHRFGITAEDKVLALSSLNFDLSVYDIFGLLAAGGTVVFPPPEREQEPDAWLQLLEQERITLWNTVPALMQALLDYVDDAHLGGQGVDRQLALRLAFLSGDWIPLTLPGRIRTFSSSTRVISLGGATEASIWSILYPIDEFNPEWKSIPYGKPMVNQQFYVLDDNLEARPAWVPGHLYIGGIGLAKGYWRDKEKTQASFIFHPRTGMRLYRTGDLGRYYPDGNIEFLGREDFQVKVQGHRIELGEIEHTLVQHPEVREAVVNVVSNEKGRKHLVAYVVAQSKTGEDRNESGDLANNIPSTLAELHSIQDAEINDGLAHLTFKLQQPGIRRDLEDKDAVQLIKPVMDGERVELYRNRRSYRSYLHKEIPFAQFSALLDCLLQIELGESPLPKYRYASAGSLYPVQAYVYIKPHAVENIASGTYYYHPRSHQLILLSPDALIDSQVHADVNQAIFNNSAFSLFLVGNLQAIAPLYGDSARDFCLIESGYISQLLMMTAPQFQIGLCPIGGLNFAWIRDLFCLNDGHILLHALLGGAVEPSAVASQRYLQPPSTIKRAALEEDLKQYLENHLPRYMQPKAFVLLDQLPLTSNGKVNRKDLPVPDIEQNQSYVQPRNKLEQVLADIWADLLELKQVSVCDNYYTLGGDSLQTIRMISRAKQVGITLTFELVGRHQTIAELAAALREADLKA